MALSTSDRWAVGLVVSGVAAAALYIAADIWQMGRSKTVAVDLAGVRQAPITAAPNTPAPCVLSIRGTNQGPVVFPTAEGAQEFDNVLTSRADAELVNRSLALNGGLIVGWRTPCRMIDEGFSYSKVRVLDGPRIGLVGWVPTSQTRGN